MNRNTRGQRQTDRDRQAVVRMVRAAGPTFAVAKRLFAHCNKSMLSQICERHGLQVGRIHRRSRDALLCLICAEWRQVPADFAPNPRLMPVRPPLVHDPRGTDNTENIPRAPKQTSERENTDALFEWTSNDW
jgi:hypothetical protein